MKDLFLRFPHIGNYILEKLDKRSLYKCREVCKIWKQFIDREELPFIIINKYTGLSKDEVKKILSKTKEKPRGKLIL